MGLLTTGEPLDWYELKPIVDYIKQHGLMQFIYAYHRLKDRLNDCLKWGDEIEYLILKFDHDNKKVRVSLRAAEILKQTAEERKEEDAGHWHPEFASYMLEGIPSHPYGGYLSCTKDVEVNMRMRRREISRQLLSDEVLMTIGNFPRLGCEDCTNPSFTPNPNDDAGFSRSIFLPDEVIYSAHPRFGNLARIIRQRRGSKVTINVPIYQSCASEFVFNENGKETNAEQGIRNLKKEYIAMDAMGFGMGCCCLQVTLQLVPLTPIMLALSASTPIFRGCLSDVDCRWNVISESVDDRTDEELGLCPLKSKKFVIQKSRYDSVSCYLSPNNARYNDVPLEYDEQHFELLKNAGIDNALAKHVAHLFLRDPLQVFKERIEQEDNESTEHFESIQSTNWVSMRFKLPPEVPGEDIGWRVEFRSIEVQLTDFQNAALVSYIVLLTRVILSFRILFVIPISKVDANMQRAQTRNALLDEKFYFRRTLVSLDDQSKGSTEEDDDEEEYVEMTIDEVMNGGAGAFPGLLSLVRQYLNEAEVDIDTRLIVEHYLKFIEQRSKGEAVPLANFMREFVLNHPSYEQDCLVGEQICYDLMKTLDDIANGRLYCPKLVGKRESN